MKTHEILKMTQDEYELLIMDWWVTYCSSKSANDTQLQKLLTDATLFNWWHAQLTAVEKEFEEDAKPYVKAYSPKDAKKLYAKHAYKLGLYYNHNLLLKALKK